MSTTQEIQPRPTRYKGYHFRSRLEARYAVFFDKINEPWEYESEGYRFDGISYLPDFYLPGPKIHVEIKPTWEKAEEVSRTLGRFRQCVAPIVCMAGLPGGIGMLFCYDACDSGGGLCDDDGVIFALRGGRLVVVTTNNRSDRVYCDGSWNNLPQIVLSGAEYEVPREAINAARSARFEHGQSGAT